MKVKLSIFALAASGNGVSGGDRIFIELSKRWSKSFPIEIFVWEEGKQVCHRMGIREGKNLKIHQVNLGIWCNLGFVICYLARIIAGVIMALKLETQTRNVKNIVYSASEFWMDSIPAFILKLRNSKIFWVAAWYQTSPNPLRGYSEGQREKVYRVKALIYWLIQFPIKPLINYFADLVFVNNEYEKKVFRSKNEQGRVVVMLGAVNLKDIFTYQRNNRQQKKIFDAVFQGRFHPQKGVVELIDIWNEVVKIKKDARLVMIGDGPLMEEVKQRIKKNNLESNIYLVGFVFDGPKKYELFSKSRLAVHPSFYDSGGMATAEAMAFGLPAVAFNLRSYDFYYPKGVLKVSIGDKKEFASAILKLLQNSQVYTKISKQALEMIKAKWDWESRSQETLQKILSSVK